MHGRRPPRWPPLGIVTALPQLAGRWIVPTTHQSLDIATQPLHSAPSQKQQGGREQQQQRRRAMADGGAHKRPLDEDANGGALVAVKKARQDSELVVASKRPEIKSVRRGMGWSTARQLAAQPCTLPGRQRRHPAPPHPSFRRC